MTSRSACGKCEIAMTQSGHPDYDYGEQHWLGDAIDASLLTDSARDLLELWKSLKTTQEILTLLSKGITINRYLIKPRIRISKIL